MLIVFYVLYGVLALWAIISIILYGNRPGRSIAWLFVIAFLPILGVIFYILFGINRKRFKFLSLNHIAKRKLYDLNHSSDAMQEFTHKFEVTKYQQIGNLLKNSSGFPAIDGNQVEVLKKGRDSFRNLFNEIKNATSFIHLEYYILEPGEILDELCKILDGKLDEGVEVRIIYDAVGSFHWKTKAVKNLMRKGAQIHSILPLKINEIVSTLNYRNHRKLAIIDGVVAFTGGMNITDKYIERSTSELGIWSDLHIQLKGSIVDHLHRIFIKDFYFASKGKLLSENEKYLPKQEKAGDSVLQIVSGGPDLDQLSILHQYVMMIHNATESILIENPYFIPNKILLEALKMASLRGVEVCLLVPKNSDSRVAKYSMYSNFEELLKTGVSIFILKNTFSHSKLIIVDEAIASIGSGNFDYRSFEHNYELNTLMYDRKIAQELAEDFRNSTKEATTLDYESFKNRPLKDKLLEGLAKIFSPLL